MSSRSLVLMLMLGCRAAPTPPPARVVPPLVVGPVLPCHIPPAPIEVPVVNAADKVKDAVPWAAVVLDAEQWFRLRGNMDRYRAWVAEVIVTCEPPDTTGDE